ncbi:hypothetical protein GGR53DRAFT_160843 [Hypoxylon sp. FL1150]|nr:hypothetical protein GGR53DRAFT_160843 [Hypoxylon sp. FL1150]
MTTDRKRKVSLGSAIKGRTPKRLWKEQLDADGDIDMESPTVNARTATDNSAPSTTSETVHSSPLTIRITGPRQTPLFPTSTTSARPSSEVYDLKDENTIANKNERYVFDSFCDMMNSHVAELKERPICGISKDSNGN